MSDLPEWYDDIVRLALSGRRFYHTTGCEMAQAYSDAACHCGAASANRVLDRVAQSHPTNSNPTR